VALTARTVPAVVAFAVMFTNPALDVDVYTPVALNEIAPFVAIAPAVELVARRSEPVVSPVVETMETSTPVVAAPAVTSIMPVPVYAPVVVAVSKLPATEAVELNSMSLPPVVKVAVPPVILKALPDVRAAVAISTTATDEVAAAATIYRAVPVVSPDGVTVANDVVVVPVNVPEPATARSVCAALVLSIKEIEVVVLSAVVTFSFPEVTIRSPAVKVNAAVAKAEPAITVAPDTPTEKTESESVVSQASKYLPVVRAPSAP
jgi:hypothetical protein